MDTKALRQKILDLAIRGKLVPQDPNDEPASVLLERIRAEKQKMVKEGKLKAKDIKNDSVIYKGEDNLHYEKFADGTVKCIEDEIPFDIPDSWAWTRLNSVGEWKSGATPSRRNQNYYNGDIPWIKTGDLNDGYIIDIPETITQAALTETAVKIIPTNTVLIAMYGATIGKVGITTCKATTNQACCACCNPTLVAEKYLFYFLQSQKNYFEKIAVGGAQPNISKEKIVATLIPIPPITEQIQIVTELEKSFELVNDVYDNVVNIKCLIRHLKSHILDLAIRGKLVPQDPNEEPASALLERIKAEKEESIKQGKIKREKTESAIFKGEDNSYYEKIGNAVKCIDTELPFRIPEKWTWCRMNKLMYLVGGVTYNKHDIQREGIRILRGGNLTSTNAIELCNNDIFLPESYIDRLNQVQLGDIIIVASTGSTAVIGKPAFVESYYPKTQIGGFLKIVRPITKQAQQILWLLFRANYYHESILDRVGGVNINNIKSEYLENMLIPVPPKCELDLIIDRYSQLSKLLSNVEANLN